MSIKFIHSGNIGDIIYALPTVQSLLTKYNEEEAEFHLIANHPAEYAPDVKHPLGNVYMNEKIAEMLVPLLKSQRYISSVTVNQFSDYENIIKQPRSINLDMFRKGTPNFYSNSIVRWYFSVFGTWYPVWEDWMTIDPDLTYKGKFLFARSLRTRSPSPLYYYFLKEYKDRMVFIGLEDEYTDFLKLGGPECQFKKFDNFLELGRAIAGCDFFYGNSTFSYSIAEAIKIPRMIEISLHHTTIPQGGECYDFYIQQHMEYIIKEKLK